MKVSVKQKNAKLWNKESSSLNQAQVGEIQIVYKDENGVKKVGYVNLTDIDLEYGDETISIGDLLTLQTDRIETLIKANEKLTKQFNKVDKFIQAIGGKVK